MTAGRANRLALQEAYRPIPVREGDEVHTLPTIQVVMRQQARSAAKGSGPAQRHFIDRVQAIEREAAQAATTATESVQSSYVTDEQRARALAAFLERTGSTLVPIAKGPAGNSELGNLMNMGRATSTA